MKQMRSWLEGESHANPAEWGERTNKGENAVFAEGGNEVERTLRQQEGCSMGDAVSSLCGIKDTACKAEYSRKIPSCGVSVLK